MNGSSPTGGDSASATATATPVFDHHHIGIFWDYENVHLPSHFHNMDAMGVGDKIREALRPYGRMIHEKNVYLDVVDRQCRWQSELQQANFRITNCPTKRTRQNDVIKEVVDKIIISEMWRFAYKTRGLPCLIVLIASDGDYTHTISALRDVGVKVLVWHGGVKATTDRHVDMLTSAADHSAHFIIDILGFVGGGRGPHARGTGGARASFPAPPPTNVASLGARAGAGAGAGAGATGDAGGDRVSLPAPPPMNATATAFGDSTGAATVDAGAVTTGDAATVDAGAAIAGGAADEEISSLWPRNTTVTALHQHYDGDGDGDGDDDDANSVLSMEHGRFFTLLQCLRRSQQQSAAKFGGDWEFVWGDSSNFYMAYERSRGGTRVRYDMKKYIKEDWQKLHGDAAERGIIRIGRRSTRSTSDNRIIFDVLDSPAYETFHAETYFMINRDVLGDLM